MNRIYEFVASISISDIEELVKEWDQFEQNGHIGECMLRKHAENILCNTKDHMVPLIMKDIIFECYKKLYIEYKELWIDMKAW